MLREKLDSIRSRNPSYSLRAFAKRLDVHPAALSEILNGKRTISTKLARRIAQSLALDEREREQILLRASQGQTLKRLSARKSAAATQLELDQYFVVSEWRYYALLSLAETRGFRPDPAWIARRLGISEKLAKRTLERLERLGFFEKGPDGGLAVRPVSLVTSEDEANAPLRRRHEANLEAARESLSAHSVEERELTFITMAIDPGRIPGAKAMIREFRDKLCAYLEAGEKAEVYELCIQLFPRTVLDRDTHPNKENPV